MIYTFESYIDLTSIQKLHTFFALKITALDIGELIRKLELILQEIHDVSTVKRYERFLDNAYADIKNRNNSGFWHPTLIYTLQNSNLCFGPFFDAREKWSIRYLKPVTSEEHPERKEISVSLNLIIAYGFVKVLRTIQYEMESASDKIE